MDEQLGWQYKSVSPAGWLRGLAGVIRVPVIEAPGPPADEDDEDDEDG